MDRTPAFLAALANSAVPGLHPITVHALVSGPDDEFDVAFVEDAEHRRWVVRAPRSAVASARMERGLPLVAALGRKLPFSVPLPKGFAALKSGGRAMVAAQLAGVPIAFENLPAQPGLTGEIGRALAAIHNTDPTVYEEAGASCYDAQELLRRHLTELDRAAATRRVPASLLARWEQALEDVSLWQFAPVPVHGDFTGDQVLALFDDVNDASTGHVRSITGWEDAHVGDPAQDFLDLVALAPAGVVDRVLEAYANALTSRPDKALLERAHLLVELRDLSDLLDALTRGDFGRADELTERLREVADLHDEEDPAPTTLATKPAADDSVRAAGTGAGAERGWAGDDEDPDGDWSDDVDPPVADGEARAKESG